MILSDSATVRKDVECTFGIFKGRWRVLKAGVQVHGSAKMDQVFKTCCALHNWLLEVDGRSMAWADRDLASIGLSDLRNRSVCQSIVSLIHEFLESRFRLALFCLRFIISAAVNVRVLTYERVV